MRYGGMTRGPLLLALPLASLCVACAGPTTDAQAPTYANVAQERPPEGPFVPGIHVQLVARAGARLQRFSPPNHWADVCIAPCDSWAPLYGFYRVSAPERTPTGLFTLPPPAGTRVALRVHDDGTVQVSDSEKLAARRNGAYMQQWLLQRQTMLMWQMLHR
jgi:hypothetical protein